MRWYTNTIEIDTPPDEANPADNVDVDVFFSGGQVDRVELEVGRTSDRGEADRLTDKARALGFKAFVVRDEAGRYRIAAGPFRRQDDARRAARALERALGRSVRVRDVRQPQGP